MKKPLAEIGTTTLRRRIREREAALEAAKAAGDADAAGIHERMLKVYRLRLEHLKGGPEARLGGCDLKNRTTVPGAGPCDP